MFVVWEPVLDSDADGPSEDSASRVFDARVTQFWDPDLKLSKLWQPVLSADPSLVRGKSSLVTGRIVWDYMGVIPAGVTWGDRPPLPKFQGAPVVRVMDDFERANSSDRATVNRKSH